MKIGSVLCMIGLCMLTFCTTKQEHAPVNESLPEDSLTVEAPHPVDTIGPEDIEIEKDLLYDQHTLADTYPYKDTTRQFQWDKMRERLALLERIQNKPARWAILQNYKNRNGEAPLVKVYRRNTYKRIADTLGVERYQSVPLYTLQDTLTPEIYGRDGALVKYLAEENRFIRVEGINTLGEWFVPKKYVYLLPDTVVFRKAIFVDRVHQNIATLEQVDSTSRWLVRSMNPATTGLHRPPYAQETPTGLFVLQEKKTKMIYLVDGSKATGGFAPYASRFTNGGYIHGVPVNAPRTSFIEYSPTLGTIPRSHMCVRNATSHAKFIYDWAPINETIIFVFD